MRFVKTAVVLLMTFVLFATGCGAVASVDSNTPSDDGASAASPSPTSGDKTATVRLSNGETFEVEIHECKTQLTDPRSETIEEYFDVFAQTSDGDFRFSASHLSPVAQPDVFGPEVSFRGFHDENGVNPEIKYISLNQPERIPSVAVDGNHITVESLLFRHASNTDWGDEITATFSVTCG